MRIANRTKHNIINEDDYRLMLAEISDPVRPKYGMLYRIADSSLRKLVRYWCATSPVLSMYYTEDDLMQDIYVQLIKSCVTGFLKNDTDGGSDKSPEGFNKWMFSVAKNVKREVVRSLNRYGFHILPEQADDILNNIVDPEFFTENNMYEIRRVLSEAFDIVLGAGTKVYKSLAWLAQFIYVLKLDTTRIKSNDVIIKELSEKTMFEMRDIVIGFAEEVTWLHVTESRKRILDERLNEPYNDELRYGDVKFSAFFMAKGGKASVSDWVNRMDRMIRARLGSDAQGCM